MTRKLKTVHPEGALMRLTRQALRDTTKTQLDIFADTGISPNWQTLFSTGKIADPSVNRVEFLYTYLTGRPLDLSE